MTLSSLCYYCRLLLPVLLGLLAASSFLKVFVFCLLVCFFGF